MRKECIMREASVKRTTAETDIDLWLDLDGNGSHSEIHTGVGFLDHMLVLFSRHSGIEMKLRWHCRCRVSPSNARLLSYPR